MAGDIPNLNVEILVQLSNLTASVQEATAGLNKIGDSAKAQESKFSGLKTTMLGVFAGNLMAKGTEMLIEGLHDAMKAISDTQVSTEHLATALNDAKQNTAANRDVIESTSAKMRALGFSTNTTEDSYAKLVTATGSTTQATKLMSMAADLARYKHEDLTTAATTLARGTQGSARAFREMGITLDTTIPKNQAIAKAMDELNGKIGGQAVGYTHTFAGEMEILKAKFDEVANKVGAAVMPILTKLLDLITKVIIPVVEWLVKNTIEAWIGALVKLWNTHEGLRKVVVDVIKAIVDAMGYIVGAIAKVIDAASHLPIIGKMFKGVGAGVDEAAKKIGEFGKTLDSLANKKISLGSTSLAEQLATVGSSGSDASTGVIGEIGGPAGNVNKAAKAAEKALTARNAKIKTLNDQAVTLEDQMNTALADRQTKMDAATATRDDAVLKANETFNQSVADINQKYDDAMATAQDNYNTAVENATDAHNQKLLDIQTQYADKTAQLEQAAVDKRQSIIDQSIAVMTNAFESATKIDIGKLFTAGGGSASGLVSQLQDQMASIVKLQKDAGLLAAQGYNQSFINEVIAQGPAQGDALAQSVLTATPDTQNSIKSLYAQIQNTSQNGLNTLAAQMNDGTNFATQALAKQYAQVGIDLQTQLASNSAAMQSAMDKENDTFNKALATAQDTLNKATKTATDAQNLALQKAQDTLQNSIQTAQDAFSKSVQTISDSTMKQLDALQTKLQSVAGSLTSLGASTASISSYGASIGMPTSSTSATSTNPLGGAKDTSNFVNYNVSVTGYNLTDPNATAQQTVAALKFGTPIAANVSTPSPLSGTSARGN